MICAPCEIKAPKFCTSLGGVFKPVFFSHPEEMIPFDEPFFSDALVEKKQKLSNESNPACLGLFWGMKVI